MKKFALIALLALVAAPVFADDVTGDTATSTVKLHIYKYCECTLNGAASGTTDDLGNVAGNAASVDFDGFATFTANANFAFDASLSFAWTVQPTGNTVEPVMEVLFDADGTPFDGVNSVTNAPNGYYTGTIDGTVTFDLTSLAGDYEGTLTLEVGDL